MPGCIVVVEDDADTSALVCDLLAEEIDGTSVIAAHSAAEAISISRQARRLDLAIIDLMLPSGSGMEVAEQLRADGYESVPFLAITASRHLAEAARESTLFRAVLEKPFELDELLLCVHELVGESRSLSAQTPDEISEPPSSE